MRWRDKNGIQDLEKAKRYIDMIIEKEKKEEQQLNLNLTHKINYPKDEE